MAILSKYIRPEVLTRIARIKFEPNQLVEGTLAGAHKSPFHGFAIEFAGHRDYVPGDDVRHLDWKVYYRHRKYLIKQYELDTNLNGEERAFVITGEMEKVMPIDIYPMQLLKATMVGDIEKMENLGIYEVAPEDFALIDFISSSKIEAQDIIRKGLDLMIKEVG